MATGKTQPRSPILELIDMAVSNGTSTLFSEIDIDLLPGELIALVGPSGCGKTTLLRSVAGLIDAGDGEVLLSGLPAREIGWPLFRRQVLYIDQKPVLLDDSVRRNLERPFRYKNNGSVFFKERAEEYLELLGMPREILNQNAWSLSVGQQQRICLLRALLLEPRVLLLDEPTSSLDEKTTQYIEALLKKRVEDQQLSALVVTHNLAQANRLCTHQIDLEAYMPQSPSEGVAP